MAEDQQHGDTDFYLHFWYVYLHTLCKEAPRGSGCGILVKRMKVAEICYSIPIQMSLLLA